MHFIDEKVNWQIDTKLCSTCAIDGILLIYIYTHVYVLKSDTFDKLFENASNKFTHHLFTRNSYQYITN